MLTKALVAAVFFGAAVAARDDLSAWDKPDGQGHSCSSCHSPDGIELAAYGFDRATLLRRATPHLAPDDRNQVADLISKEGKGIRKKMDPMVDRPLQPGGSPLPGSSPVEKDDAFLLSLPKLVPHFFGKPIKDLTEARAAAAEMSNLDVRKVRVGIATNRISEDGFHGPTHATLADWLPDVAVATSDTLGLRRAYLQDPSYADLQALDKAIASKRPSSPIEQLAVAKYRSLLLFQHSLRTRGRLGLAGTTLLGDGNPLWDVGEFARQNADGDPGTMAVPDDVRQKKTSGASLADQMRDLRLPWYWAGWTLDPSLTHSGGQATTRRGDYFTKLLWSDGPYPAHMAFMLTKKLLSPTAGPKQPFEINYSFFLMGGNLEKGEPVKHRGLFRTFVLNSFRMILWMLEFNLDTSNGSIRPEAQASQIKLIASYFRRAGDSSDLALCDRVSKKLLKARVISR